MSDDSPTAAELQEIVVVLEKAQRRGEGSYAQARAVYSIIEKQIQGKRIPVNKETIEKLLPGVLKKMQDASK